MKGIYGRWSVVFSALLIGLAVLLSAGCHDSSEVPSPAPVLELDTTDPQAFVRHIVSEYLVISEELVAQYQLFKETEDTQGFILFRNNSWTPAYIESKTHYNKILFNHKAYIYRQQLDGLFDIFFGLQPLSVLLKRSLLQQDWDLEQQAIARISADRLLMMKYLKADDLSKAALLERANN